MQHTIYFLFDPRLPSEVRYVGFTANGPRRLWEHLHEAKTTKKVNHKLNWIRSLLRDGVEPLLATLEEVTVENWQERERYWISAFKETLTNSTDGGEGLINPSQEVRDRIAEKCRVLSMGNSYRLGISHTEESRQAISDGMKNSVAHKAACERKVGINAHANLSLEAKAAIGEKIRQKKLGVKRAPFSDDCRAKMAAARVGRKWINDGSQSKQLPAGETLPEGWNYGRMK